MIQKRNLRLSLLLVLVLVLVLQNKRAYASNTVNQLEEEKKSIMSDLQESQTDASELEDKKEGLEGYLDELNGQLTDISDNLSELDSSISNKEKQIERIKENLKSIQVKEKEQYNSMKQRIKYMYEQDDESYVEIIFSSGSFTDALNHASYVKEISNYDRQMLEKYQDTKRQIKEQENQLVKEQDELSKLQKEAQDEQNRLAEIMKQTSTEIANYEGEIAEFEAKAKAYEEQIRTKETQIEEEKKEQERIIQAQAQQAQMGTNTPVNATDTELTFLAAIIQCEAEGESYEGQVAVGAVVLNRVRSSLFPNNIIAVIYQAGQFSPVASGRFAARLAQGSNASCTNAAIDALAGANPIGDALFFKRNDNVTQGQVLGHHVFY